MFVYNKPEFLSKCTDRHCYIFLLCFVLKTCEQRCLLNNCISKVKRPLKQKGAFGFCKNHAHQSPKGTCDLIFVAKKWTLSGFCIGFNGEDENGVLGSLGIS